MRTSCYRWLLLIVSACYLLSCASRKSNSMAGRLDKADQQVQHGQVKFMKHCQSCHPGGEAGLGPAINSNPAPGFIKRFQVRHGLGAMPAFKRDEISRQDLRAIMKYLKVLKKD